GVGAAARREGLLRQRDTVGVDRGAAEDVLLEGEIAQLAQDVDRRRQDLRADPVAGEGDDAALRHGGHCTRRAGADDQALPMALRRSPLKGCVPGTTLTAPKALCACI